MPAFSFQKQFVPLIKQGLKKSTIRADRKDRRQPAKEGDVIKLYTGLRTKTSKLIGIYKVVAVQKIMMISIPYDDHFQVNIYLNGIPLEKTAIDQMAGLDGFQSSEEMIHFFQKTHGKHFSGWHITWGNQVKETVK